MRRTGNSGTPAFSGTRRLGALLVVGLLLSGCGFRGMYDMPLPGGADVGDDSYQVRVHFEDVLDLVPNASVRVNEVPVGRVEKIGLAKDSWEAEVTVRVNGDVELPANATARLRQSSLLGEKFVELADPPQSTKPTGQLADGDLIGIERTNRNPQVEEVLSALSLLLNGGGVAQLQTITRELNTALEGRTGDARNLLSNLDQLVSTLDSQRNEITRALDSVNRLSASLNDQRDNIDTALRDLEPGLRVLNDQREQLVTMLQSLDKLSHVGTDVVNRSQEDLVRNLRSLQPTLRQLAAAGDNLPKSLELLLTYPFTDEVLKGIKGDYVNLYMDVDLNLTRLLGNVGRSRQPLLPPPDLPPLPLPDQGNGQPEPKPEPKPSPDKPEPDPGDGGDDDSGGLLDDLFGRWGE